MNSILLQNIVGPGAFISSTFLIIAIHTVLVFLLGWLLYVRYHIQLDSGNFYLRLWAPGMFTLLLLCCYNLVAGGMHQFTFTISHLLLLWLAALAVGIILVMMHRGKDKKH